jgi:hypothetical protein
MIIVFSPGHVIGDLWRHVELYSIEILQEETPELD